MEDPRAVVQAAQTQPVTGASWIQSHAIILHDEHEGPFVPQQLHLHRRGARVLDDVVHELLRNAVDAHLHGLRQPLLQAEVLEAVAHAR